jgi:hypothetical protein
MRITELHLARFRQIKRKFYKRFKADWRGQDNNGIWRDFIIQILVVGGVRAADTYVRTPALHRPMKYGRLVRLESHERDVGRLKRSLTKLFHRVLRQSGSRYAWKNMRRCRQTKALVHNFLVLSNTKGGPRGFMEKLATIKGHDATARRVEMFLGSFEYVGPKTARDFLNDHGLSRDNIAIDARIVAVFKAVGIRIPTERLHTNSGYSKVENEIIEKVCRPLSIDPVEFDKMLFRNADEIKKMLR